jgi:hypothetical protein
VENRGKIANARMDTRYPIPVWIASKNGPPRLNTVRVKAHNQSV